MKLKMSPNDALELASGYANVTSGCRKVKVGSVIVDKEGSLFFGANVTVPMYRCLNTGCQRIQFFGDNSKTHRNPEDCRAVHSEIDAIISAKKGLTGASIYVTRYPCEACARAIVLSGIQKVYYGREQTISAQTQDIFESAGVEVYHISNWKEEDVNE